jgi:hypothetical protein
MSLNDGDTPSSASMSTHGVTLSPQPQALSPSPSLSTSTSTSHLLPLPSLSSSVNLSPYTHPTPTSASTPPPLPARSRMDPAILQNPAPLSLTRLGPRGLIDWAKGNWMGVGKFLGIKGWDIGWSLIKYGVWGPPRPSWGIEMTALAAVMRNLSAHSSLADITLIRNFISVHHLLPLPPDAIVTPVRFEIKKRPSGEHLRGFLQTLDEQEDGTRQISGEWVVNKSVWRRLRIEAREREVERRNRKRTTTGASTNIKPEFDDSTRRKKDSTRPKIDADVNRENKPKSNKAKKEKVIYYIHGGMSGRCALSLQLVECGKDRKLSINWVSFRLVFSSRWTSLGAYYVGQATTHRTITIALSKHCNCRVFGKTGFRNALTSTGRII